MGDSMKRFLTAIKLSTLLAAALAVSSAKAELLSTLIANQGFIVEGDKKFDGFSYLKTGDMPVPPDVNVTGFTDGFGNFGINFQGAFTDLPGGGASDALVEFRVSVLDPNARIVGADLAGNPSVIGGQGFMSITETFLPDNATAILNVFDIVPGPQQLADSVAFPGQYTSLRVQKDILAFSAGNPAGIPTLSFFTQTFHQRIVPEPATWALLGLGLLGFVGHRLRRKS